MTRRGEAAVAWGRAQIAHPTSPYGTWYRYCLAFVRIAFDRPGGVPDAGTAWDTSARKHHTENPLTIPRAVPVFWELPSVADHVALSLGDGMCLSNDILRSGQIDRVPIQMITTRWGGQLLGWTEDCNGDIVYVKPDEPDPTRNITAYLEADDYEAKVAALKRVRKHGSEDAAVVADKLLSLHKAKLEHATRIGVARKELRRLEVKE